MRFIQKSIADLFNTSIGAIQLPDLWKSAGVTPIFNVGDKVEMSNYRPISVLTVIARLFEKLIANQLYQHMRRESPIAPASLLLIFLVYKLCKKVVFYCGIRRYYAESYYEINIGKLIAFVAFFR